MHRPIKSFVLRAGRVSPRQSQGLQSWLKEYELPLHEEGYWSLETIFGRKAPTVVEIGFGMGASLLKQAQAHPEINYIGIEVHRAGLGSLAADLHDQQINNVRIAPFDAIEIFKNKIADETLSGIQIFFPDPWPKKRHHKRRLIQNEFVSLLTKKLQTGGFLHCATDWEDYSSQMLEVLSSEPNLKNQSKDLGFVPRPETRPKTKFENRGLLLGHGVWDLFFLKT
jgi:tRNA (guanine-N7-)-methyltransferase